MPPQTPLTSFGVASGWRPDETSKGREHRRDCCDDCGKDCDCSRLVIRCFHEASEDCSKCRECVDFANRFIKPSKPVAEIEAGDR